MRKTQENTPVYQDCLRLYIENGEKETVGIEREMRRLRTRFGMLLNQCFGAYDADAAAIYD